MLKTRVWLALVQVCLEGISASLRAYPNNPLVARLSEKFEAKAAPVRAEAWLKCHIEDVLGRQRRPRASQLAPPGPAAVEGVIGIGS